MRYHVVLKDDANEDRKWIFDNWQEAEIEARFICRQHDDWVPDRYPGRSSRTGEVAVFLDRRVLDRHAPYRELAIIRANPQRPVAAKKVTQPRCRSGLRARPSAEGHARLRRAAITELRIVRASRRTVSGSHARA
jgi:hypothetical protein